MGRQYTYEQKINLIEEFKQSNLPKQTFAKSKNIPCTTFRGWYWVYTEYGAEGLKKQKTPNHYSAETKISAVKAYRNGEGTLHEVTSKYGIKDTKQLRYWLIQYNDDKKLTDSPVGRKVIHVSKKTTLEERIQVVEYVTLQDHSYAAASEHFQVSYQQVRMWVMKAEHIGYSALADERGHKKTRDHVELTELDKLKLENRQLKAELEKHKVIEAFEKKFNEIQRGE
ncbi:MAG: transposase [Companilactobacillus sp.]|jgi:transposase-like protein|uniref:helix-turn-helix domain-containing protein n=2 Tax=Companilactobacillus sp. TaxID=2767905 RepID=UPI0025BD76B0|nr:helix-turn-helix domain-containing protein [Companilactobacillus sp.]MCH4009905.1 transposase [Companilactobacillus sp.]MCH4052419.1 transposase [Companilactobacillus sp.]MCH4077847.1 transposase [Companilactobacillus sp.]MCH4126423.1 transposase [Companilactobacillus sp.]